MRVFLGFCFSESIFGGFSVNGKVFLLRSSSNTQLRYPCLYLPSSPPPPRGIMTRHKNKFDCKSDVPFLLPFLLFHKGDLVVVNSSYELIVIIDYFRTRKFSFLIYVHTFYFAFSWFSLLRLVN